MVTMSPLATCAISWPSTASTSPRFSFCSSPLLTATSARLREAPVAKAFGSAASNTPTSGVATWQYSAWPRTVSSSQRSVSLAGASSTRTRIIRLASQRDSSSDSSAPPKPMTSEKTSSAPRSRCTPRASSSPPMPSSWNTTPSTSRMAKLTARNQSRRCMGRPSAPAPRSR